MTQTRSCPVCGSQIPANAPAGQCPRCLLKAGIEPSLAGTEPSPVSPAPKFAAPSPDELASQFPDLEILELLGHGGMGAVYKARQTRLERTVAIKILPRELSHDPAFAERFTREARALAKLSHQNIVAV